MQKTRKKEEAVFIAITFGVTWSIWLGAYIISISSNTPLHFKDWLIRLGTAAPSFVGLLLTYVYGGAKNLKTLLRALIRCRASLIWWLYTIALFPLALFISWLAFTLMGGELPPPQFPVWFIPVAFFYILAFMGPLGEEMGWRGFLLDRLAKECGLEKAAGILGVIWFAWHIPLFFIQGTIQNELAKMGVWLALTGYLIYTVCISQLITVLYARTKGNLMLCVIFHTICNLSLGAAPLILTKIGAAILLVALIFITTLTAWLNRQKRKTESC